MEEAEVPNIKQVIVMRHDLKMRSGNPHGKLYVGQTDDLERALSNLS